MKGIPREVNKSINTDKDKLQLVETQKMKQRTYAEKSTSGIHAKIAVLTKICGFESKTFFRSILEKTINSSGAHTCPLDKYITI